MLLKYLRIGVKFCEDCKIVDQSSHNPINAITPICAERRHRAAQSLFSRLPPNQPWLRQIFYDGLFLETGSASAIELSGASMAGWD
jgi:hypothetical protein